MRRQIQGMPMGMPAAPQIANLACYPVEKAHAYALGPGKSLAVCRYIDDLYSAGVPLPPPEAYGMEYKQTSEGESVVYLGVKVYILKRDEHREVHTTVYDREEAYPYHIIRYPEFGTVAPPQQLGGVIMGRLVHCQETCSHMKDLKESVGMVFRNALWRGYSRRLVQSVWSRFLFQRWHSTDIRVKELRVWFSKVWGYLAKTVCNQRPEPSQPVPNVGSASDSRFLQIFGVPSAAAAREPQAQPGASSGDVAGEPVPQSPVSSSSTVPMDRDEEEAGAVVPVSQPFDLVGPVAGEGEQAPVEMAVDPYPEAVPQEAEANPQESAQSEGVVVALMEETRQAAFIISASGNQVVQHAEVRVRQRACVSDGAQQVSAQRLAGACVIEVYDATPKERMDEDEVDDEVRPEGYLSGSSGPGGETRGFRDPLRADDPSPCLTSSSSFLALPAPPGQVPLLPPPPPPPEPSSVVEVPIAERSLKRKAEEQGSRSTKRRYGLDENRKQDHDEPVQSEVVGALPAPPAHPGDAAEPLLSPPTPSPAFHTGPTRSQRPRSQRLGQPIRKAEWDARFRWEFESYQRVERVFRRQIWEEWDSGERRRAYIYLTNKQLKEEMKVWKREEEERVRGSAVRVHSPTSTQDGGLESNPDL